MGTFKLGLMALVLGVAAGAYLGGTQAKERLVAEYEAAAADSLATHAGDGELDEAHAVAADAEPTGEAEHIAEAGHTGEADSAAARSAVTAHDTALAHEAETAPARPDFPQDPDVAATEGMDDVAAGTSAPDTGAASSGANPLEEGARKLAKIFGAMKPADAADVLKEMEDAEVKAILEYMSDRKAAQILGAFPPERAARLSQVVLTAGGEGR